MVGFNSDTDRDCETDRDGVYGVGGGGGAGDGDRIASRCSIFVTCVGAAIIVHMPLNGVFNL